MTFVVLTFLLSACLLTYLTKLTRDAIRERKLKKYYGKESKETETGKETDSNTTE